MKQDNEHFSGNVFRERFCVSGFAVGGRGSTVSQYRFSALYSSESLANEAYWLEERAQR